MSNRQRLKCQNKYRAKKVWMCEQGHVVPYLLGSKQSPRPDCMVCNATVVKFDSQKEANRWAELKLLERAGKITDLRRQVKFPLSAAASTTLRAVHAAVEGHPIKIRSDRYPNGRQVSYIADFVYTEDGKQIVEDVKGLDTPLSRLKRAILEAMLGIQVRIT